MLKMLKKYAKMLKKYAKILKKLTFENFSKKVEMLKNVGLNQGWKNITITPLVIVSYRYFYITITNEVCMITNDN